MFSGLTNQVSSWMGKQESGEGAAGAADSAADPTQSEIAADAGEQQFENVPVGDESEGAKATRCVMCSYKRSISSAFQINLFHNLSSFISYTVQQKVRAYFQMCNRK